MTEDGTAEALLSLTSKPSQCPYRDFDIIIVIIIGDFIEFLNLEV